MTDKDTNQIEKNFQEALLKVARMEINITKEFANMIKEITDTHREFLRKLNYPTADVILVTLDHTDKLFQELLKDLLRSQLNKPQKPI